jgi:hypothetical protein
LSLASQLICVFLTGSCKPWRAFPFSSGRKIVRRSIIVQYI